MPYLAPYEMTHWRCPICHGVLRYALFETQTPYRPRCEDDQTYMEPISQREFLLYALLEE
jgi:hypothetical protein